MVRRVFCKYK